MKRLILLLVVLVGTAHADTFPKSGPCEDADACETACKANKKGSCYWGGVLILQSAVDPESQPRALALFDKACAKGDAEACWQSANLVWDIESRELKAAGAKTFAAFQKACNKNHARACMRIADIAAESEGDAKMQKLATASRAKGVRLLEAKCNAKVVRACSWVADMYETGDGVKLDQKKAAAFRNKRCVIETGKKCAPPVPPPPPPIPGVTSQESKPMTKQATKQEDTPTKVDSVPTKPVTK